MYPAQRPGTDPEGFSRCEERKQGTARSRALNPIRKTDAAIKGHIDRALQKDDVLRAIESYEMEVSVKDSIAYLDGHIVSTTSQGRIQNALRSISGLRGLQNNLILDDRLILEVAASLGALEQRYNCKFFTGASHGVISLNGVVRDEHVKLLAEQRAASHPNVRGVINNVQVIGAEREQQEYPFLQPAIGQTIYFLDGISGIVRHVIVNPNNRRVVAMALWGPFTNQRQELKVTGTTEIRARSRDCLIVVPMDLVRHMTKVSGFLLIHSNESKRYMDFDPARFSTPSSDWKAPYPYCPEDVLFPVEKRDAAYQYQILEHLPRSPSVLMWEERPLREEHIVNDSPGGER